LIRSVTGGALRRTPHGAEIEALRGITCTISHGDRLALIGHNGAGKTTFLRLISGIYAPSSGFFKSSCAVYPMIRKSFITGPDLSGLQAVKAHYLLTHNHLHGFPRFLEEILEFTELGDYIHLPMRGYSEGMSARLLFALLTSGAHECLALDEGLGAGDARFVDRAQQRLKQFIESSGTLILASHSEELLRKFCTRALVFNQGQIVFDGSLESSLDYYHEKYS
jgi:lipopolysaccharide transport system ATP-binding protein